MCPDDSDPGVLAAGREWRLALERLVTLRRLAPVGAYASEEIVAAGRAYERAEEALQRAGAAAAAAAAPAPFEPTPRMRFVRWLVRTGRLSEWT